MAAVVRRECGHHFLFTLLLLGAFLLKATRDEVGVDYSSSPQTFYNCAEDLQPPVVVVNTSVFRLPTSVHFVLGTRTQRQIRKLPAFIDRKQLL